MTRIRDNLDEFRSKCIGCGACTDACPSHRHGGCDPQAVMEGDLEKVFGCVGCGYCSRACERGCQPKLVMLATYSLLLDIPVSQAFKDSGLSRYVSEDAPGSDLKPVWTGDDVYVMPGCVAKCEVPYVEYAASSALRGMGFAASELPDLKCCMYPIQFGTMEDEERKGYLLGMGKTAGGRTMVSLCGGCDEAFGMVGVDSIHLIGFLHEHMDRLPRLDVPLEVAVEPGCAAIGYRDQMVEVVRAMGCVPVMYEPGCCGKGNRNVGEALMAERQDAAADADVIVVGCPMCQKQYDAVPGGRPSMHLAELVAWAFGDTASLERHAIPAPGSRRTDRNGR